MSHIIKKHCTEIDKYKFSLRSFSFVLDEGFVLVDATDRDLATIQHSLHTTNTAVIGYVIK